MSWGLQMPITVSGCKLVPLAQLLQSAENRGEEGSLNISLILVFTVLMGCLAPASLLFLDRNSLAAAGRTPEECVPQQLFSNPGTFTWR